MIVFYYRETAEVLDSLLKKGNHLKGTFCLEDLWIPSGNNTLVLLPIPTGGTDMEDARQTKVSNFLFDLLYSY